MTERSKITEIDLEILQLLQMLTPTQQEGAIELVGLMVGTDKIVMEVHNGKTD